MRIATRALVVMLLASMAARAIGAPPIFRFESEEFWLNLHAFLYVLGRAEDKFMNAAHEAVAGAPTGAQRGCRP